MNKNHNMLSTTKLTRNTRTIAANIGRVHLRNGIPINFKNFEIKGTSSFGSSSLNKTPMRFIMESRRNLLIQFIRFPQTGTQWNPICSNLCSCWNCMTSAAIQSFKESIGKTAAFFSFFFTFGLFVQGSISILGLVLHKLARGKKKHNKMSFDD